MSPSVIRVAEAKLNPVPPGLFDRAIRRIAGLWREVATTVGGEEANPDLAARIRDCLAGRGGEVSARTRAAKLAEDYAAHDDQGRLEFLKTLAGFDSDPEAVDRAARAVAEASAPAARTIATADLRRALEPPRLRLLTAFTAIPDGMKFVVDLRERLLAHYRADPALAALEADAKALLAGWFDVGFLELRRIDWSSPALLLEKLVGYEAVHEIRGWRDLKNRLDSDRRCYAFFHPRMPNEPLIFVEVALVRGLAGSVQALLDQKAPVEDPTAADTAIFYSISTCQRGLSGISFGNFLIKRVVEVLRAEFRNLKTFATLSPMPGFRRWLDEQISNETTAGLLTNKERSELVSALGGVAEGQHPLTVLLARRGWMRDPALVKMADPVLVRLGAWYLISAGTPRRARDPVAHFHLSNGARVERLMLLADTSDKGAKESATLMVNYLYDPARIEAYHEAYAGDGERTSSAAVRRLARVG